jgi:hypothetical protein
MPNHTINKAFSFDNINHSNNLRPNSQAIPTLHRNNTQLKPQSPLYQLTQPANTIQNAPSVKFNYRGSGFGFSSNPISNKITKIKPENNCRTTPENNSRIHNPFQTLLNSTL